MPPDTPIDPPTFGPIAGKYELVKLIGRGGMGTVWEGRHASLGTRVAIKFIDTEYADSPEARTRFDNEARAAATIQSKHAIQIFDHGVSDDGKPYIVMELLQGEPLDQRLDRFKRLPLAETARILRQVARALQRAHERGIVHRDLKPENIFLVRSPDDDDEIAKVLDFGIAKFRKVDGQTGSGISSSTKTGAVIGTPFYMSPEQARGLREIDHRSDIWSIGVIAFKCVCGILPFEGVSVGDLLVKICTAPAPVPSAVVPSLSPSFDTWFARTLEKEPSRRFQSATEMADALAYAAGLSVKRPVTSLPPSDGTAATVPSTPVGVSSGASATSAPFTASTPRTTGSSRSVWFVGGGALVLGVAAAVGTFAVLKAPARGPSTVNGGAAKPVAELPSAPSAPAMAVSAAATEAAAKVDAGPSVELAEPAHPATPAGAKRHHPNKPAGPASSASPGGAAPPAPQESAAATEPPAPKPAQPAKPAPAAPSNIDPGY